MEGVVQKAPARDGHGCPGLPDTHPASWMYRTVLTVLVFLHGVWRAPLGWVRAGRAGWYLRVTGTRRYVAVLAS